MEVDLLTPIAMDKGQRFAIREGGRTVGSGVVSDEVIQGTPKREPAKNVKPAKELKVAIKHRQREKMLVKHHQAKKADAKT